MNERRLHIAITGASSGLGAALAEHYAAAGRHHLTLLGRNEQRLHGIAARCRDLGASAETIVCDIVDRVAVREVLHRVDDAAGVDILIANAGIGGSEVLAPASGESAELAHRIVDTNLGGVINCVTALSERFVQRGTGHIVMISSLAAYHGLREAPVYSASKAAVRIYGEGLRRLLAETNVNVTVVSPGFILTPMAGSLPFRPILAWPAERAAKRIGRAIERRQRELVFPWQLAAVNFAAKLLPGSVVDAILHAGTRFTGGKP